MADFSEAQLKKKTVAELTDIIEKNSIEVDEDAKKPDLIDAIKDWQEHKAASGADDDEEEDDEVEEVDDSDEEEDDDTPTAVDTEEEDDLELPEEDEVDEAPAKPAAKAKTKAAPAKQTKYTEGGTKDGEKLLGAKEVATAIGTDAKSLRQFFRSGKSTHFTAVGAGGRYEFKESDVEAIGKEFEAYKAGKPGRGRGASSEGGESKPRASRGKGKAAAAPVDSIDEVEEIEDLEELEGDDLVEEISAEELDDEEED